MDTGKWISRGTDVSYLNWKCSKLIAARSVSVQTGESNVECAHNVCYTGTNNKTLFIQQ